MKNKFIVIVLFLIIISGSILGIAYNKNKASQSTISDKIIRFHVIANSDTVEDQALKLKVRDEVLNYISPKLRESSSIDESRKIVSENDEAIKEIAKKVIVEKGYTYQVRSTLSHENFPVKSYANITLPQGKYEAYRIIIGSGEGQNWWCVMFPPLCFTDITKGEVNHKDTESEMKQVLTKEEYNLVNNSHTDKSDENEIVIKFKFGEIVRNIYRKIQGK